MSGRLTSLIITEGRIRDGGVMAAELEGLIDQIDSPPALRAEILMAIAFAQYSGAHSIKLCAPQNGFARFPKPIPTTSFRPYLSPVSSGS